jgi:hypothetical protein
MPVTITKPGKYYTTGEAARILDCSISTLLRKMGEGKIPGISLPPAHGIDDDPHAERLEVSKAKGRGRNSVTLFYVADLINYLEKTK